MANTKAYTHLINTEGSDKSENNLVHQASPSWVVTFISWEHRDTLRTDPAKNIDFSSTRKPLIVENDCVRVSTTVSKSTMTPSVEATFVITDVNYMTQVAPGDFMFVNMLNWPSESRRVAQNARDSKPINGIKDGFKGVFKVQSVRRMISTDPKTGTKLVFVKINGYAFTEFNNTIYFNPYMIDKSEQNNLLFASLIGTNWGLLVNNKGLTNIQEIIRALIESFVGCGISDEGRQDTKSAIRTPNNTHFFIPKTVGSLLGVQSAKAAKDIYVYLFGIQQYAGGNSMAVGMNPSGASLTDSRFIYTGNNCQGEIVTKPEYWNQVKVWSILNQFTNAPLNELFTTFRVSPNNKVMPTVVFRQLPFTNDDFDAGGASVTRFLKLPRWKLSPGMVTDLDIGRDEAARINFVQYFGRSTFGSQGYSISEEIAAKNYLYDKDDVSRSGLRPYVISTQFDEAVTEGAKTAFRSSIWAKIIGDSLIGGHLKLNGTITCVGILAPIAVGDNLEFDGVVYHIEQVNHTCTVSPYEGEKTFKTTISLSSGISKDSDSSGTKYAEMTYSDADSLRDVDGKNNKLLPGVSDSQDVIYRDNLDGPHAKGNAFTQPNNGASVGKASRGEKDKK